MTMPPMGSRSILSIERGPRVVRMMLATALAAEMLFSCAVRPDSRFVLVFWAVVGKWMDAVHNGEGAK